MPKQPILIVEDDPQLNQIFTLTLRADFETTSIADGSQALAYLQTNTPDAILLDLNLPGASGEKILGYIRSEKRLACARIILATADAAKAETCAEYADLVLLKPISPIQLRDLVLRFSRKTDELQK